MQSDFDSLFLSQHVLWATFPPFPPLPGRVWLALNCVTLSHGCFRNLLCLSCFPAFVPAAGQDVSGGKPVLLEGVDLPLWGLEVDVEEGRREFAEFSAKNNTADQVIGFRSLLFRLGSVLGGRQPTWWCLVL